VIDLSKVVKSIKLFMVFLKRFHQHNLHLNYLFAIELERSVYTTNNNLHLPPALRLGYLKVLHR